MDIEVRVWTKEDILALISTNKKAVVNAIKGLYARQTADERSDKTTRVSNGRGFNAKDARFLSDIAVKLPRYNDNMTDRQLYVARKMLRKYWRQLLEIAEEKGHKVQYPSASRAVADSPISEDADSSIGEIAAMVEEPAQSLGNWGIF